MSLISQTLMYVDPTGYSQTAADIIKKILNNWDNIESGTTFFFSGGYFTHSLWGNGWDVIGGGSGSGGGGGGIIGRGPNMFLNFWINESGKWSFFRATDFKLGSALISFRFRTFVWNGWSNGSGASSYSNSANNAGADILDFSIFDGDMTSSVGIDMSLLPLSTLNIPIGNPSIEVGELIPNARMPNSFYEAAQLYEDTPYLWGGSSATGTDCSGLVCLSTRAEYRWTTSGGNPPGNWSVITYNQSRAGFMQVARIGDLLVWTGRHTAFFAGGTRLFHAHGSDGTPTGYTYDLIWYLNNCGYPLLYRQNR